MAQDIYTEKEASKDLHSMISEMDRVRRNNDRTKYSIAKATGVTQSNITRIFNHSQFPGCLLFIKMIKSLGGQIKIGDKMFL